MRYYLHASIALHAILPGGHPGARSWIQSRGTDDIVLSSTLLALEMTRVLRREGLDVSGVRVVADRVDLVSVDDGVLRFAGALQPHVTSLDAIHLATCLMLGHGVTLMTHDRGMRAAALDLGLDVADPLSLSS